MLTPVDPNDIKDVTLVNMYNDVTSYITSAQSKNYYPLLRRKISVSKNLTITGTFKTTCPTDVCPLCYITVGRDVTKTSLISGIGFAWKTNNSGDVNEPNLYLVYNSPDMEDSISIGGQQFIANDGLINFLVGRNLQILPDTEYDYQLNIDMAYGMKLWIAPVDTINVNGTPTLISAQLPNAPNDLHDYFGISVLGTVGYEWLFDNIRIAKSTGVCPMVLFNLNVPVSEIPDGTGAYIEYYGGVTDSGINTNEGLALCIYAYSSNSWELLEFRDVLADATLDEKKFRHEIVMSSKYRSADNTISILAASATANTSNPFIKSNYISITRKDAVTLHSGGKVDVYVNDVDGIIFGKMSCTIDIQNDGKFYLNEANGFSKGLIDIISISYTTGGEIAFGTDWNLLTDTPSMCYSCSDTPFISFAAGVRGSFDVYYYYWGNAATIQAYVDSDAVKLVGTDTLVKHYAPTTVWVDAINFKSNNLTEAAAKDIVTAYVRGNSIISVYGIVNALTLAGAYYVDTANISIKIKEYDQ